MPPLIASIDLAYPAAIRDPLVLDRMMDGSLGEGAAIAPRSRELMILRTCARCRAEFEWCSRIATFDDRARWSAAQARSIVQGSAKDLCWNPEERLVMRVADQVHDRGGVDGSLRIDLATHFTPEQAVELLALAGLYRSVSHMVEAAGVLHDGQTIEQPIPT